MFLLLYVFYCFYVKKSKKQKHWQALVRTATLVRSSDSWKTKKLWLLGKWIFSNMIDFNTNLANGVEKAVLSNLPCYWGVLSWTYLNLSDIFLRFTWKFEIKKHQDSVSRSKKQKPCEKCIFDDSKNSQALRRKLIKLLRRTKKLMSVTRRYEVSQNQWSVSQKGNKKTMKTS